MTKKSNPQVSDSVNHITINDRKINILLSVNLPRIVVFEKFLTDPECDQLIEMANKRLARSSTVDNNTGEIKSHPSRTSSGMFFSRGENNLIKTIEERISSAINWPVENGEGLQVLHYEKGQRYLPHNDYFDTSLTGTQSLIARSGNRIATFLMYLATPDEGGSTSFPDAGIKVQSIKGNAVFFSYESMNSSSKTLHGGDPVISGEKYVATKWLREKVF